jgi:hypothetical protein
VRAEIRAADECWELLAAARDWHAADLVDEAQLAAIRARHPDDRRRSRPGFRLLFFVFTIFGGQAVWAFVMTLFGFSLFGRHEAGMAALFGVLAALSAFGAEFATTVQRLRGFGVEEGLVALTLGAAAGSIAFALGALDLRDWPALFVGAGAFCVVATAALWRWATPLTGLLAGGALFAALYALPGARSLWIAAGACSAWLAWRGAGDLRVGPAHRRRCDELFVVATLALYLAVHVSGLARDGFGWLTHGNGMVGEVPELWRGAAWTAMGALPAALVALGLRRRDRLALALGTLLAIATATSAADALDLEPVWLVLVAGGAALIGVALAARRAFARSAERTAGGFTDRPLGEATGARSVLEIAAVLATLTPAPRQPEPVSGFEGQGGDFGGGGASGKF